MAKSESDANSFKYPVATWDVVGFFAVVEPTAYSARRDAGVVAPPCSRRPLVCVSTVGVRAEGNRVVGPMKSTANGGAGESTHCIVAKEDLAGGASS